jgi:hypothetical protein
MEDVLVLSIRTVFWRLGLFVNDLFNEPLQVKLVETYQYCVLCIQLRTLRFNVFSSIIIIIIPSGKALNLMMLLLPRIGHLNGIQTHIFLLESGMLIITLLIVSVAI